MVSGHLSHLSGDAAADAVLSAYLVDLSGLLLLSRRSRTEVLAEIADGLACAVDRRVREGVPAAEAARAAVVEFGGPAIVAVEINRQRLAVTAHRVGLGLVATGPAVGLAWILARTNAEQDWPDRITDMLVTSPLYPAVLVVTISMCLVAYAGAGSVARRIRMPTRMAALAAVIATITCVVGDLILIGGLAIHGEAVGTPVARTVLAAAASTVRLSGAAISLRLLLRLREAAT